jgi:ubiquinone biosynthesis protein UbiJ
MRTIKLYGKAEIDLAREFAALARGSVGVHGDTLALDEEDAGEVAGIAADAEKWLARKSKRAGAKAASRIAECCRTIVANARYLDGFAR